MDAAERVRLRARDMRQRYLDEGVPPYGMEFLRAVTTSRAIYLICQGHGDIALQGARAKFESEGDDSYLYYDTALPIWTQCFCIAHEIGHAVLHAGHCLCDDHDITEQPDEGSLPGPASAVEVYHPRQQIERDANLFAAEFLAPRHEVRDQYRADSRATIDSLAHRFGVSRITLTQQLIASLTLDIPAPDAPLSPAGDAPRVSRPVQRSHHASSVSPFVARALSGLDSSQMSAATLPSGPVLVDAGPGTGKTRTLIARAAWLVGQQHVPPASLLLLTFSNRATAELRERLTDVLGDDAMRVTISTFHAYAMELLKRYAGTVGLSPHVQLIDELDARHLLRSNLGTLPLVHYRHLAKPDLYLKELQRAISRAKDELVDPRGYADLAERMRRPADNAAPDMLAAARAAEVATVYHRYQQLLTEHALLDYGDLLFHVVTALEAHPEMVREVRGHTAHILVDEYQDTNRASGRLLKAIAGDGAGLWVVGDPRQSIYRFRGASPENMHQFDRDFPGAHRHRLGRNYRSAASLVDLFGRVASHLPGTPADTLPVEWEAAQGGVAHALTWATAPDHVAEQHGIASTIRRLRDGGIAYTDQAILCRSHGQAETLAAALEADGIPTRYLRDVFDRPEVKDLLAVLSVLCQPHGTGLLRLAALPDHPISTSMAHQLLSLASHTESTVLSLLTDPHLIAGADTPGDARGIRSLAQALHGLEAQPVADCWARYLFDRTGYGRRLLMLAGVAGHQVRAGVAYMFQLARGFAARPGLHARHNPQRDFLSYIRFVVEYSDDVPGSAMYDLPGDGVRLLTAHASKGLEFHVVFLPHIAQGHWPSAHRGEACPDPPGLADLSITPEQDEAHLFFVAISRARQHLVLSRAERYGTKGAHPGTLWELVEPHALAIAGTPTRWEATEPADDGAAPSAPPSDGALPTFAASELELYIRCPRRYYYERVLGLAADSEEPAAGRMHLALRVALEELSRSQVTSAFPSASHLALLLDAAWQEHGPVGHVYEQEYRDMSLAMLERRWRGLQHGSSQLSVQREGTVTIDHAIVRVRIDSMEQLDDGSIRLVRFKTGKPTPEHTREHRVLLYHLFGEQVLHAQRRGYRVDLEYLGTGEVREVPRNSGKKVPKPRMETQLTELNAAALGITAERYPTKPEQHCQMCSFNLICPI